jgi:CubicO group peptidase (beta-lactamase class C family)
MRQFRKTIKIFSCLYVLLFVFLIDEAHTWKAQIKHDKSFSEQNFLFKNSILDSFITAQMQSYNIPGIAACAIHGDQLIWNGFYGFANINNNKPVADSTLFMLASISKTFTGVAFMQLYENGLIGLDDDINIYLPFSINIPQYPGAPITPRMLLSHVSGITDNWNVLNPLQTFGIDSPIPLNEFIEGYLTSGGLYYNTNNFNGSYPGTQSDYSNVNATLIAYLVEVISGLSFEQYCQDNIFIPLGMSETSWFLSNLDTSNIAMPYTFSGGNFNPYGHYGSPVYPCGFLKTSTVQLARYLIAIMQGGQIDSVTILNSQTIDTMLTLHYPQIAPGYGLLWFISDSLRGHPGIAPGVSTLMYFKPGVNSGVIVLSNIENYAPIVDIFYEIFNYVNNYSLFDNPENDINIPENNHLFSNYPNPFNSSTIIPYYIQTSGKVEITIYNTLGKKIRTLVDGFQLYGYKRITWNGKDDSSQLVGSGLYFCYLKINNVKKVRKMILLK